MRLLAIISIFSICLVHASAQQAGALPDKEGKGGRLFYEVCIDSQSKRPLFVFLSDHGSHNAATIRPVLRPPSMHVAQKQHLTKQPFLTVHGNVLYDVNYYSNIDTPYMQRDVYQHTVQTYLDITVKDHYPMRFYFTTRFSNARLFKSFSDLNLQYNRQQFAMQLKEQLKRRALASLPSLMATDSLKKPLDSKMKSLALMESGTTSFQIAQNEVGVRERNYFTKKALHEALDTLYPDAASKDTLAALVNRFSAGSGHGLIDSLKSLAAAVQKRGPGFVKASDAINLLIDRHKASFEANEFNRNSAGFDDAESLKGKADSLRREITLLTKQLSAIQKLNASRTLDVAKEIDMIQSPQRLREKMDELGLKDTALPSGYKTLLALRSAGIGRSVVNYSELSVKNISVNGVQVEYNPSFYVAVAAGTVDYRFRDFLISKTRQPSQYVGVVRVGYGPKEGNNVILTYYTGRKQIFNAFTDTMGRTTQVVSPQLMGFTVETNWRLAKNHLLTGEIAKSSMPYYAGQKPGGLLSGAVSFHDRSNEAYSLKIASYFPATRTRVDGYYKKLGINFQSFSIFTNGSASSAWSARVSQPFFKQQLQVTAALTANDFSNPYVAYGYHSTTVFKSLQATLRRPGWPVFTIGYFPSSQLTKLSDDRYVENLFYTLVGNAGHYYRTGTGTGSTTLVYTRFYNRSADSNFVYFNTSNLLLNQGFYFDKVSFQMNMSDAVNAYYNLYTLEGSFNLVCNEWLSIGAGSRYSYQTGFHASLWGYSGNISLQIPMFGEVRMMADKGFIPGPERKLVSNNIGRLTYIKTF